jgi:hypothetical protein
MAALLVAHAAAYAATLALSAAALAAHDATSVATAFATAHAAAYASAPVAAYASASAAASDAYAAALAAFASFAAVLAADAAASDAHVAALAADVATLAAALAALVVAYAAVYAAALATALATAYAVSSSSTLASPFANRSATSIAAIERESVIKCCTCLAANTANNRSSLSVNTEGRVATQRSQSGLAFSHTSFIEAQEAKAHSLPSLQALCLVQNCSMVISCVILLRPIYCSFSGRQMVFEFIFAALVNSRLSLRFIVVVGANPKRFSRLQSPHFANLMRCSYQSIANNGFFVNGQIITIGHSDCGAKWFPLSIAF